MVIFVVDFVFVSDDLKYRNRLLAKAREGSLSPAVECMLVALRER